ncbi:MAG TPA: PAS domain S-box protein [Tenuifilaceae bacterium]|nr:PAS domain S-box protein [Tenuifilaceae bacterium]
MFIIDLIYNLSALVALSIVSGFIDNRWSSTTKLGEIIQGLLFGGVAMLGMINPLVFDAGIVFDGRSVVISLCALFFGPIAAAISSSMAIVLRVYQGGAGAIMGVSVITASALIGVFYHYRRKRRSKRISTLFLLGFGLLVHIVMLALTLTLPKDAARAVLENVGLAIIVFYPIATILIGKILHDQEVKVRSVQALRSSEEHFRSLANDSPIGIWRVTPEGIVVFANQRVCKIMGCSNPNDIISKPFIEFVYFDDLEEVNNAWKKQLNGVEHFSQEFRIHKPDGTVLWVFGQFQSQINEFGDAVGFVGSLADIDEQKKFENELLRWQLIFNATKVGVAVGNVEVPKIEIFNPAFAEIYGYSPEEIYGKSVADFFAPEKRDTIPDVIRKSYENGFHVFETVHIKKDGSRFPALLSMTGVKDEHGNPMYRIVNVQDITELKKAEAEINAQRLRLENIIKGTNVGTWEWKIKDGEITVNERWAEIIGYTLEDLQPTTIQTWQNFSHPDDFIQSNKKIEEHFSGQSDFYECEVRMKHSDGSWVWVLDKGSVAEWDSEGNPLVMYGTHFDITERKRAEETLKQNEHKLKEQNEEYLALNEELTEINTKLRASEVRLKEQNEEYLALNEELTESNERIKTINQQLDEARKKAEQSDSLKSAFLANMSHEIRTPMNAIIGFSNILTRPNLSPEKQKHFAKVINASCNQLLTIINDVLDISKIETGQVSIVKSSINVNSLLRSVQSLFLYNATNKKNKLQLQLSLPDNLCIFETDETKLSQILSNLVSNAIKFTNNGIIEVGYDMKNSTIEFYVNDTGIGIAEEHHQTIFDRFRQVDMSESRNYGGTGLGLAISKAFVELLGGKIWVTSEVGVGSSFRFTLPYDGVGQHVEVSDDSKQDSFSFNGSTILVAEDEEANYIYVSELLSDSGVKVIRAFNGAEAVEHVRSNPKISLILMDVKMPVMNGLEATTIIKNMRKDLPVIALTAYAMVGDREKCLQAGCDSYIAKPIFGEELLREIGNFLKM